MQTKANGGSSRGRIHTRGSLFGLLTLLTVFSSWPLSGQVTGSASLSGTVRDQSGSPVPDARVVLTETARKLDRESVTNEVGRFVFPNVPVGAYALLASKEGFESSRVNGIQLEVGQQASLEVPLTVGAVSNSVEVSAKQQILLETESNTLGTVVDSARIEELPLNGRNVLQLALLAGGANSASGTSAPYNQSGRSDRIIVVGGNFSAYTSYLLNGISIRGSRSAEMAVPLSPAAVDQFKVQQSFFMADQGPNPSIISVTTKGGGNQFHGEAFEFLRNVDLDSRNFFSPGPEKLHRNQFGFAAGGPIRKDRIWFYGHYEGLRQVTALSASGYTPTSAMFSGNFGALSKSIYDPLSFNADVGTRTVFANNIIPQNRLNPVAQSLLKFYTPSKALSGAQNLFVNPRNTLDEDQYGYRMDASLTQNQTLFGQMLLFRSDLNNASLFPAAGAFYPERTEVGTLQHNWTIGPSLVGTGRIGFTRTSLLFANEGSKLGSILPGIGIMNTLDTRGVSAMNFSGVYSAFGRASGDLGNIDNVYQASYGVNYIRGSHNWQFGSSVNYYRTWQQNANASALGGLTFQPTFTAQLTRNAAGQLAPQANTGDPFADFLLGIPTTGVLNGLPRIPFRYSDVAPYAQDNWKIRRGLTLNYGISWYKTTVPNPQSKYHEWPHAFDYNTGLLQYAALGQVDPRVAKPDNNNFAPRLGLAWQPHFLPKTVIRAGAGIYYATNALGILQWSMVGPPYTNSLNITNSPQNPLPTWTLGQNIFPPASTLSLSSTYAASLSNVAPFILDQNLRIPYVEQWNVSVQHSLTQNNLVELIYLGNSAHRVINRYDYNQCRPTANLQCLASTVPYPRYSSLLTTASAGNSSYEALVARFDHRLAAGFNARFEYTIAKAIDDTAAGNDSQISSCRRCEKTAAAFDTRSRAVMSLIYDLPVGRGRKFGAQMSRVVDAAAGGWTVTTIGTFQTGTVFQVTAPNQTVSPYGSQRPNRLCDGSTASLADNLRSNGMKQFNTSCFALPASGYFGNAGRNILYGPGVNNWDIGLQKHLVLTERIKLQFRGELFNAFNHAQFGTPNATFGSASFGVVTSASSPRLVQLGLRLIY